MQIVFKRLQILKARRKFSIILCRCRSSSHQYEELIDKYANDNALHSGKLLHGHLVVSGLAKLTHFASKLIAFYTECGQLVYARKLFDKIPRTNIRRWIVLIGAHARCGFFQEAMDAFFEMQRGGVLPNEFIIPSILKACGHLKEQKLGEVLHCLILKCSIECDAFVNSALIDMYSRCGLVDQARKVFDGMSANVDLVALNAMVSGYAQQGLTREVFELVERVELLGVKPNLVTWNTLIAGFSRAGDDAIVSELFRSMRVNGVEADAVSWTSIISGFVHNFRSRDAFDTFKLMLNQGFYPTSATISCILPACATIADLKRGKEIHGYALVIGLENDVYVKSALIDMYAKCGFISEARTLFYGMSKRNTVTWNSMIFGYANHGYCHESIELFFQMEKEEKNKLDYMTFMAVLVGCCHAGMVELGKTLFRTMQEKYMIKPRLEHYACMVDLIGRAGKLAEAYDLIKAMPMEPDLFVWGALLGACKNHGNIELAEVAAKHLAKLEPQSAGGSVLMSNLYAVSGSWGNANRLKKMMKKRKLRKFPGSSWIDICLLTSST